MRETWPRRAVAGRQINNRPPGDASALDAVVMRALSSGRSTPQELDRIRELVAELARARGRKR